MKVCIVGAGAVGGLIGARLAHAGVDVSAVARNATAAALREHGWRLQIGGQTITAPVRAVHDGSDLAPQDYVVIAVKGPAMVSVAPIVRSLAHPETTIVSAMNGVPWWFFHGLPGAFEGLPLATIDPDGVIAAAVPVERVIGAVVHLTCSTPEPGVVRHGVGNRLIVGEPKGVKVQGGIFEFVTREVEVECLPEDIPDHVTVDVTELMIGRNLRVSELPFGDKVKVLTDPTRVVAHVVAPKAEEEKPAEVAEAAPAEPEVIRKGKAEEEGGEKEEAGGEKGEKAEKAEKKEGKREPKKEPKKES